jgi:hypothetical protein
MAAIVLSGGGYSGNWLPLVFPLVGVLFIIYAIDFIVKFVKKRRLHHHIANDHSAGFEDSSDTGGHE